MGMGTPIPLFVPIPGGMEIAVILGLAVLLFGADRIPKLARSSGQAMSEFKRGRMELEEEIRDATTRDADATGDDDPGRVDADDAV